MTDRAGSAAGSGARHGVGMTDRAGRPIGVAIVDDHPVVREGTAALLDAQPGLRMVGTAASIEEATPLLDPEVVDVLLLDIRLGSSSGLTLLNGGSERVGGAERVGGPGAGGGSREGGGAERVGWGRPAILVLTAYDYPQYAAAARRLGAAGFIVKTAPVAELVAAIRCAAAGGTFFGSGSEVVAVDNVSRRELEVVRLVVDGASNDEIGVTLGITTKTVEGHLRRLFERLGIQSRTELATRALREGWLDVP